MKRLNAKEIAIPALALFVICLVVTGLLAGTNLLTKDTIERLSLERAEASRRLVLPAAATIVQGEGDYYVGATEDGKLAGYVFTTEAKGGYGGPIQVMTGVSADGQVTGVVILSQNETPGLGANATKESFRSQYLQPLPQGGFRVVKSAPGQGEIQAMTGATITSTAVTNAVNLAVEQAQALLGKGDTQ
jgi:electron transport complex protein RnfG